MDLEAILANVVDQDRGAWLELRHPVSGKKTGIRLLVAGPDSRTAGAARLDLADELAGAMDIDGRVAAELRDAARVRSLARLVLDWSVSEKGEAVPFSQPNLLRLVRVLWVQVQLDAFAGDRQNFMGAK